MFKKSKTLLFQYVHAYILYSEGEWIRNVCFCTGSYSSTYFIAEQAWTREGEGSGMRLLYLIIPSLIDHLSMLVNGNHRRRMKKMPHPYYKTTFRCDCGHFDKKFVVRMTIIVYCDNCARALLNIWKGALAKTVFYQTEVLFHCLLPGLVCHSLDFNWDLKNAIMKVELKTSLYKLAKLFCWCRCWCWLLFLNFSRCRSWIWCWCWCWYWF